MSFWKRLFGIEGKRVPTPANRVVVGNDCFDDGEFLTLKQQRSESGFEKGWRFYRGGTQRVFERAAEPCITGRNAPTPVRTHPVPAGRPVDKSGWKSCHRCGRHIPVQPDWVLQPDGTATDAGTYTYVCPFCGDCHVGTPNWNPDTKKQDCCHECRAPLGDAFQCPHCSWPRSWARMSCEHCGHSQPVPAPHWVDGCDLSVVECVRCERMTCGLCVC